MIRVQGQEDRETGRQDKAGGWSQEFVPDAPTTTVELGRHRLGSSVRGFCFVF